MPSSGGFALVVALSLMAFILLLVLSISTLVTVESKSSSVTVARLKAEQAALLGLQVALGELQKAAGPDQRVTARADRLDAPDVNRKYYTGVINDLPIELYDPKTGWTYGVDDRIRYIKKQNSDPILIEWPEIDENVSYLVPSKIKDKNDRNKIRK